MWSRGRESREMVEQENERERERERESRNWSDKEMRR